MKKQLVISLVVFAVGFGLGYGITWLLVSGDGAAPSEAPKGATGDAAGAPAAAGPTAAGPTAGAKPAPTPAKGGDEPSTKGGDEPPAKGGDEPPAEGGDEPPTEGGDEPPAQGGDAPDAQAGDEPEAAAEAVEAEPKAWWDQCVGRRCLLDFGKLRGGLSIRKGSIKHGSKVDWKLRFSDAPRLDILPTDRKLPVEVRAVGLDADGQPTAAEIEWRTGGKTIVGVIALKLGTKRITMTPPAD